MDRLHDLALALQHAHAIEWLLPLVLKVTLIASIGRLLIAALPRASASTRYLVAVTTFCSMLAVPLIALSGVEWNVALLPPSSGGQASSPVQETFTGSTPILEIAQVLPRPITRTITVIEAIRDSWRGWLLLLAAAVAGGFLVRMLFGMIAIATVTRGAREIEDDTLMRDFDHASELLGVDRLARVLVSERVTVPLMWGIRRPALLLPAEALQWSRERLQVIFLHELAHLRRGDAVTLLITRGATALYWFHPLAWSLDRAARRECEQACDDLVLSAGTRASEYADHLLEIARSLPKHDPFGAVTLAMSRRSQLEGRLLSILQPQASRGAVSRRLIIAAAVLAALIVIPIAAMRLIAQPAAPPPPAPKKAPGTEISVVASQQEKDKDDESGAEWFERGVKAYHRGDLDETVSAYEKAIAAHYRRDVASYNIACTYAIHDRRDQALVWLQRALDAGFDDRDLLENDDDLDSLRSDPRFKSIVSKALSDGGDRRVRAAVADYDELRTEPRVTADQWYQAGRSLLRARDNGRAIEAFDRAVQLNPCLSSAIYDTACAYALQGDSAHALDELRESIVRGFGDGDSIRDDSDLDSIHGARFDELAKLADDLALRGDGDDWSDVRPRYERVLRDHPDLARAWFNAGYVRLESGDAQGGLAAFNQTLKLGYRPATTMYNIACSYARLGKKDAAFEWLAKASSAGLKVADKACGDDDLDSLRGDPRFEVYARECGFDHWKEKFGRAFRIGRIFRMR
jgi:beta-lactamase regulating signal transducer with metallopeptidase domain/Flp pilus assembly protein TadD